MVIPKSNNALAGRWRRRSMSRQGAQPPGRSSRYGRLPSPPDPPRPSRPGVSRQGSARWGLEAAPSPEVHPRGAPPVTRPLLGFAEHALPLAVLLMRRHGGSFIHDVEIQGPGPPPLLPRKQRCTIPAVQATARCTRMAARGRANRGHEHNQFLARQLHFPSPNSSDATPRTCPCHRRDDSRP